MLFSLQALAIEPGDYWESQMRPQVWNKSRAERLKGGVTLAELSVESGVPHCYLSEFERGIRVLRPEHAQARAEALRRLTRQRGEAR